ncbi:sarcosine oxidase subunit gamma [Martelella mediterranea]|uniref:Sarcosine oxidase subunit gamma n=1 Tax=Martelella mediterranea TaxID=293089 RepID=A0A4R3NX17_9HYPH|nr:sarcosine oxidase subunit gamma family protein [Martelella mediterranea]TCT44914.1 sarcosine oxidase subunit gamma [Martelella mediterranea]
MNAIPSEITPGPIAENSLVRVSIAQPCARLNLRARAAAVAPLCDALGLELSDRIGKRSRADTREALCLGPDEWLILTREDDAASAISACAAIYDRHPHSLVDISGREITVEISGEKATDLLTLGCPRDPETIAIGEGRRTVFDGVSVVIRREEANRFAMDMWHSFAPFALSLLATGAAEIAAEASL